MSIEILDPPESRNLTTKEKVKQTLNLSSSDHDTMIDDMISATSDFVVNYCGREFAKQRVKESLPGKGLPEILLSITPLVSVEKVEFDDTEIESWVIHDREAGIILRRGGFRSTNLPFNTINSHPSSYEENRWHFTYVGGFILPGWNGNNGTRNMPYDLERAVIDIVKGQYLSRDIDASITRYRIGDTQAWWDRRGAGSMPEAAEMVLNYYRRAF